MAANGLTTEDVYRMTFETPDQQKITVLTRELTIQEQALRQLIGTMGSMTAAQIQADARVVTAAERIRALRGEIDALGRSGGGLNGNRLLNFGRLADDMQYVSTQGLRPIINNVMELAPALGVAMIGLQLIWQHSDKIAELWGLGGTKTEAERMEELGKATARTAAEEKEYQKLKERSQTVEAMRTGKSEAQRTQAKGVMDAVAEAGDDVLVKGLAETRRGQMENGDKEATEIKEEMERLIAGTKKVKVRDARIGAVTGEEDADEAQQARNREAIAPKLAELQGKLENRVDDLARKKLADAANDPGKLDELIAIIEGNKGAFGPEVGDLLGRLKESTPGAQAEAAGEESDWNAQQSGHEIWRDKRKRDHEAEAKKKKEDDDRRRDDDVATADSERDTADYQRKKREKLRKDVAAAKDTGISDLLKSHLENVAEAGGDVDKEALGLKGQLTDRFGVKVAGELTRDAAGDAKRSAMRGFIKGEKARNSETVGAADFARQIQAGVGGKDVQQKQLDEQVRIRTGIEKIARKADMPASPPVAVLGK